MGFVGPSSLSVAIRHAQGFASGLETAPRLMLDLGSGGGLPGLVLLERWPGSEAVLLDSQARRAEFLRGAVGTLGLSDRVRVVEERAEAVGRSTQCRGRFDLVVARGFGRPAVTAECAAPFLEVEGKLVVSEPPEQAVRSEGDEPDRWPSEGLALLGLERGRRWTDPYRYQELHAQALCPDRFPRRVGTPAKRPLF